MDKMSPLDTHFPRTMLRRRCTKYLHYMRLQLQMRCPSQYKSLRYTYRTLLDLKTSIHQQTMCQLGKDIDLLSQCPLSNSSPRGKRPAAYLLKKSCSSSLECIDSIK